MIEGRTYGSIEPAPGGWLVTHLEPHVSLRFKQIFPRIKRTARPPFLLEGGPQVDADLAWFMERYPLRIDAGAREKLIERKTLFETQQADLASVLSSDWRPIGNAGFRPSQKPYGYQAQAAEIARRTGRLLLMDDLGLGKTISAFAAITDPEYLPALIVPQTHLTKQWAAKLREFTQLTSHTFRKATPYKLPAADVYICPYSKLGGWVDFAEQAGFKSVIFDEMQELRHGDSTAKGAAAAEFRRHARLVMGLTATPIYNYGGEIYQIINFLEEGALGSLAEFTTEWCTPKGGHWVVDDPPALGTYLRERHLALRRTDVDIGHEMPPLNVVTHDVPYDAAALENDDALMRSLAEQVLKGASFVERGQAAREFDMMLRLATGIAKAPHVAAFVNMLIEAGTPVLLGGWHRAVYDIWLEKLAHHNPVLFTGTESPTQKEATKVAFVEGKSNLMIMSLRSGAGLDGLQHRCNTAVFGELDWSPQVHAQFCGRLRRPGQTRQVDAYYVTTDGGSDPAVMGVLGLKASQSQGLVDPLAAPKQQHSDASRIRQLAELYLAGKAHVGAVAPLVTPATTIVRVPQQATLF